jgi:hypothetical protein
MIAVGWTNAVKLSPFHQLEPDGSSKAVEGLSG